MALTDLQKKILRLLAANRSEKSYLAGGLLLNRNWPRRSDDIDIFHDSDEEVTAAAKKDMDVLSAAGFRVHTDLLTYGCVEATVSEDVSATVIQWFGETKSRFFPLIKDEDWGARLHQADLAVNKVLAAAGRSKARDIADLIAIATYYCPLGPLVAAAAGSEPIAERGGAAVVQVRGARRDAANGRTKVSRRDSRPSIRSGGTCA